MDCQLAVYERLCALYLTVSVSKIKIQKRPTLEAADDNADSRALMWQQNYVQRVTTATYADAHSH